MLGAAVLAHQPRAIDAEDDVQVLHRDVVDDLVEAALEEGGVDGGERDQPARREPGREGDAVLLGHADVEEARGMLLRERLEPGVVGHRRRHRHHLGQLHRDLDRGFAEHLGEGPARTLRRCPGLGIEDADAVEGAGVALGRGVPFPLLGHHVEQ